MQASELGAKLPDLTSYTALIIIISLVTIIITQPIHKEVGRLYFQLFDGITISLQSNGGLSCNSTEGQPRYYPHPSPVLPFLQCLGPLKWGTGG